MPMTFGSLFSGIGGLDLGLERAGMVCKWQVEIDDFCQKVLEKHWPDVSKYKDVKDVGRHNLETVDLICGGFPCQPVSIAGKRKAQSDPRWLWPQFARVVDELRPKYVLVENVPGLLRRGMGDIIIDLVESGYDAEWDCIPASTFGALHQRDRAFIVAYTNGSRSRGQNRNFVYQEWRPCQIRGTGIQKTTGWKNDTSVSHAKSASPNGGWGFWEIEPDVGRVADGVPNRVDRLKSLGNAVVPQVAEWIGRRIIEVDKCTTS